MTVSGFIPRSNSLDGMVFDSPALRIQYNPRSKTASPKDRRGTALVSHTKKLYTSQNDSSIVRRGQVRERPTAEIVWEGNSHKVLKGFPESPRKPWPFALASPTRVLRHLEVRLFLA